MIDIWDPKGFENYCQRVVEQEKQCASCQNRNITVVLKETGAEMKQAACQICKRNVDNEWMLGSSNLYDCYREV